MADALLRLTMIPQAYRQTTLISILQGVVNGSVQLTMGTIKHTVPVRITFAEITGHGKQWARHGRSSPPS